MPGHSLRPIELISLIEIPNAPSPENPTTVNIHPDVQYSVRYDRVRFSGGRDYTLTVLPTIELNRNLKSKNDQINLLIAFGVRGLR